MGEDKTSEGNPGNSNGDAVDVAPPVPGPEDESAAEPAPRGPVVQELDLTIDNPTDRALLEPSELRSTILHHGLCRQKDRLVSALQREWQHAPIPTEHVCVYPKSINGANEIIQHAITGHIIHTIRNSRNIRNTTI